MFLCQQVEKYMAILKKYMVLHFRVLFVIKFFVYSLNYFLWANTQTWSCCIFTCFPSTHSGTSKIYCILTMCQPFWEFESSYICTIECWRLKSMCYLFSLSSEHYGLLFWIYIFNVLYCQIEFVLFYVPANS